MMELSALDRIALPADVRSGTPEDRELYSAALGFERALVEQLARRLRDTATLSGDDDASGDLGGGAALDLYGDLLPGALADAVTASGGLGLAPELYRALRAGETRP